MGGTLTLGAGERRRSSTPLLLQKGMEEEPAGSCTVHAVGS